LFGFDGWVMPTEQKYTGRLSHLLSWLLHHGNPSKPNKSAVVERELNCSINLNLAVLQIFAFKN